MTGIPSPSTLKHLQKGEGGTPEWQSRRRLPAAGVGGGDEVAGVFVLAANWLTVPPAAAATAAAARQRRHREEHLSEGDIRGLLGPNREPTHNDPQPVTPFGICGDRAWAQKTTRFASTSHAAEVAGYGEGSTQIITQRPATRHAVRHLRGQKPGAHARLFLFGERCL